MCIFTYLLYMCVVDRVSMCRSILFVSLFLFSCRAKHRYLFYHRKVQCFHQQHIFIFFLFVRSSIHSNNAIFRFRFVSLFFGLTTFEKEIKKIRMNCWSAKRTNFYLEEEVILYIKCVAGESWKKEKFFTTILTLLRKAVKIRGFLNLFRFFILLAV